MSVLNARGLTKRFGSTVALNNVDLTLEAGDPIALIGPNGAGKTTLLSLVCGFLRSSAGELSVLGEAPGSAALHGRVAALPQDAQLDPRFSVARQLALLARLQGQGKRDAQQDVARVLDLVQLRDSANAKPSELSHGMGKRIAIAQLLLGKPEFALLDEPTAGLDPPNVKIIRDLISATSGETTYLISSHNLDELEKVCATAVFLEKGQLKRHMAIDELEEEENSQLTVRVPSVPLEDFREAVMLIPGVVGVDQRQQNDFIVSYDRAASGVPDIALLKLLADKGWKYRHLIQGKTLEDRLF